jgi:hypothetical protein
VKCRCISAGRSGLALHTLTGHFMWQLIPSTACHLARKFVPTGASDLGVYIRSDNSGSSSFGWICQQCLTNERTCRACSHNGHAMYCLLCGSYVSPNCSGRSARKNFLLNIVTVFLVLTKRPTRANQSVTSEKTSWTCALCCRQSCGCRRRRPSSQ